MTAHGSSRDAHTHHTLTVSALRNTAASHLGGRCRVSPLPPLPRPPLRPPPLRPPLLPRLLVPLPLAPTLRRRRSSRRTPQRHRDAPGDKTAPSTSARQALASGRASRRECEPAASARAHPRSLAVLVRRPDGLCTAQPVRRPVHSTTRLSWVMRAHVRGPNGAHLAA